MTVVLSLIQVKYALLLHTLKGIKLSTFFHSLCVLSEFIEGMSQFSVKGDKESKLRCKYITACLPWLNY